MQSIPQDHDVVYVGCTETGSEVLDILLEEGTDSGDSIDTVAHGPDERSHLLLLVG